MARHNLVQEYFEEPVWYGGLLATRAEVYDWTLKVAFSHGMNDGRAHRMADQSAAQVKPFDGDEDKFRARGWTHKALVAA